MRVSDYIIIYLSLGAPFAVYFFLQSADVAIKRRLINSLITLFAWPVFATTRMVLTLGKDSFWLTRTGREEILDEKIRIIRNEIEEHIRETQPICLLYEWRDAFERYTGLAKAVAQSQNETAEMELFAIGENKNGKLGTVCLNRRNRNRLIFHLTHARNDFVDVLMQIIDLDAEGAVLRRAIELSEVLEDADATRELTAMLVRPEQNSGKVPVINLEQEVWNTPTPKSHAERTI
jgi:hypothetical protein